jgi:hypothetical protein
MIVLLVVPSAVLAKPASDPLASLRSWWCLVEHDSPSCILPCSWFLHSTCQPSYEPAPWRQHLNPIIHCQWSAAHEHYNVCSVQVHAGSDPDHNVHPISCWHMMQSASLQSLVTEFGCTPLCCIIHWNSFLPSVSCLLHFTSQYHGIVPTCDQVVHLYKVPWESVAHYNRN